MKIMDGRSGNPISVGDVVRSVDRGDELIVTSVSEAPAHSPHPAIVELVPLGKPFTAFGVDDDELGGVVLDGFWLA